MVKNNYSNKNQIIALLKYCIILNEDSKEIAKESFYFIHLTMKSYHNLQSYLNSKLSNYIYRKLYCLIISIPIYY